MGFDAFRMQWKWLEVVKISRIDLQNKYLVLEFYSRNLRLALVCVRLEKALSRLVK